MADLPLDKVLDFLKRVYPFSELEDATLKDVARTLLIDYFPKGETVLSPLTGGSSFLYLVFSGLARCFREDGSGGETLRYVSEKDHFGSEMILTGQCSYTAQVEEDMICYLVRAEVFTDLCERFEGFRQYFQTMSDTLSVQIWDWMAAQESAPPQAWREKMRASQFKTPIDALIGRPPVCCKPETTVSEIARLMTVTGVGSVIITENGTPVGIVTKNDLTEKVLARRRGFDVPVSQIMSKGLVSMDHKGSCFEASLRMLQNRCRHMVAMKDGGLFGVVSQYDLILLQGANPIAVVGAIDKQKGLAGLKKCVYDMSIVQQALLAEGGRIEDIWALMTTFRDTLTSRLLVLGIEELRKQGKEPPVVEYCWMTFGTPGRKETLLRKNFLEGFVYKDPAPEQKKETQSYAKALTLAVKRGLLECGLLHGKDSRVLCLPESEWRSTIMALVEGRTLPNSDNLRLFDFRGVLEQGEMIDSFRAHIFKDAGRKPDFLRRVKGNNHPDFIPLCFYGDRVVTTAGYSDTIRLKKDVLVPLTDAVRTMALEKGVMAFSTLERIRDLWDLGVLSAQKARDLQTTYAWLVEMSLYRALEAKHGVDWMLDPRDCTSDEKRLLAECFRLAREFVKSAA